MAAVTVGSWTISRSFFARLAPASRPTAAVSGGRRARLLAWIPPGWHERVPRRPQIAGLHAQIDDLAYGGIAHQVIGNLDGDLHGGLGGAFIAFGVVVPVARAVGRGANLLGAVDGGTADLAYFMGRLDIADRPLDIFFPDFLALALVEPPHRHAQNIIKHRGTPCKLRAGVLNTGSRSG